MAERPAPREGTLVLDGIEVGVSNLDRVLFPRDGLTKGDLIDHYVRVAPAMLPHLRGRPVTMVRHPRGIDGESFFQKNAPRGAPPWLPRAEVPKKDGTVEHVVCEKAADLAYLANLACITPHVWLSRTDALDRPDRLILDMDPGRRDFRVVKEAALLARELLDRAGLPSFVMTTGSRGLHVVVPLDRSAGFDEVRAFAQGVGEEMVRRDDRFTTERSVEEREGRLLVDTFRNAYAQTGVAPYAVRAKDGAPVAAPLRWEELDDPALGPRSFTVRNILRRLEDGDPWKDIGRRPAALPRP